MSKRQRQILILILAAAAVLRLWGLSLGDTVNDEVFMSFRGLGMMDFDEAEAQTTPWEWFDPDIPAWAHLSFHDHPLLVPLTQNIFMKMFGESAFAFRLPSALLGIASVYLVFLIGRWLFSVNAGLFSSGLLAVTLNHIYISRTGMQEAYVIFFLLLASYLFLKSLKEDRYLIWAGVVLGFGLLAKYNVFILAPIFLTYLLIFRRDYFLNKKLWLGVLAALLIFGPVIIYNLMLYRAAGHFDFQFSYIFGQNPEVWKVAPGKEIGALWDRVRDFAPRLIATNSWAFLLLTAFSLIGFLVSLLKSFKETLSKHRYLLLVIGYLLFLLLFIGPSYRFLTMLTPFFALSIGSFLDGFFVFWHKSYSNVLKNIGIDRRLVCGVLAAILAFEVFYSVNNQIVYYPIGPMPWLASKVRYENYNWGYNQLGEWLEKELKGKLPALSFDLQYQFLEDLREKALQKGLAQGLEPYPALFVYEGNFDKAAKLWVLDRLHIYHAWPIISLETYFEYLRENGLDYYERSGFKNYYFIFQPNIVPSPEAYTLMRSAPISIKNPRGEEAFQIYKF